MKLLLIYAGVFSALTYVFFMNHSASSAYLPLKEGLLYSTSLSSHTTLNDEVTEKILFKRTADDEYPLIEAATTENLPGKFLVRIIEAKDAKYRLVTAAAMAGRGEVAGKPQPPLKSGPGALKKAATAADQAKTVIAAVTIQKDVPKEILNINKVRDIINASDRNYFFSGTEKFLSDVTFKVKSVTPWQNKSVFTLELTNDQAKFFFISSISVTSGGLPLQVELYSEQSFLQAKKMVTIYVLTRPLKGEAVTVRLSESGGGGRNFEIPVAIP